ncbi:MAG: glycosyltransferase [Castellaniella sp.]
MKILYTNFHQNDGGGHVTYILHLARALAGRHEISIATPAGSRLYRYAADVEGVRRIAQIYTSRAGPMLGEVRRLRALLREGGFDLIHVNGSADHRHVMLACLGLRQRPAIVWTKHNDHGIASLGNRLRARQATDHVIAVSDYVAGMIAQSPYAALPRTTIRHGIDTQRFAPPSAEARARARLALLGAGHENTIVLGSTGGTNTDKGWFDLLEAVAQLPEADRARLRIIIAGALPDAAKRARVQALGLTDQLVFPGLIDDVLPVLAASDMGFVLSWREALSYACREVMAMGLPALVSDAGGLPENLEHGREGWIVPVRDSARILAVLRDVLAAPACLQTMGRAARERAAREFSLAGFVAQTQAVYSGLCPTL